MVLGGMCCGMIADKWQCHRTIITLVCLISLVAITTEPMVSAYYGNPKTNQCPSPIITHNVKTSRTVNMNSTTIGLINCNQNTRLLPRHLTCSGDIPSKLYTNHNNNQAIGINSKLHITQYNSRMIYILMFLVNFCVAFSEGSALSFIDSSTLRRSQLAPENRPIHYGRQRMFSTVGAIFGILASNLAVDFFPHNIRITCYAGIFVAYGIFTVFYGVYTILSYRGLSFQNNINEDGEGNGEEVQKEHQKHGETNKETAFSRKETTDFTNIFIKTLFRFDIWFFYLTTFISGIEYSQFVSFLFVYLKGMNAPSSLLTLSIIVPAITGLAFYAYAHNFIDLLGSKWRAIMFSFAMYFVRYLGVSMIQNPWVVLLFQPLHAVSCDLFITAGLLYLKETSPLPVFTSLVSVFNVIHYGFGAFIGFSTSGVIYQRYGGRALFRYTALLSIGWFCVLAIYVFFKERRERKKAQFTEGGDKRS